MISGTLPTPHDLADRVDPAEYARLLDYPDRRIPAGRARRRADQGRDWYARNGRPWAFARAVAIERLDDPKIQLANGVLLAGEVLSRRLAEAEATALVAAAVSAGSAVDERSRQLWEAQRPDEGYFLDRFAAAVVEHLAAWASRHLRRLARDHGLALLPGVSPGHEGWDLDQQALVGRCLTANGSAPPPRSFEVLATGMIRPKSSLLTVFGLTRRATRSETAWRRQPCSWCSLTSCGFRRVRVGGGRDRSPFQSALTYDPSAEEAL